MQHEWPRIIEIEKIRPPFDCENDLYSFRDLDVFIGRRFDPLSIYDADLDLFYCISFNVT